MTGDLYALPPHLPVPQDDGRADHLRGARVADVALPATTGDDLSLARLPGRVAVFTFPRAGRPGQPPLVPDWDAIPGARGCTVHSCGFRDLAADFASHDCRIVGLSTQSPADQRDIAERLHLPFPLLSDERLDLTRAMQLPTLDVAGHTLIARLGWVQDEARIVRVWYPVFPPHAHAGTVLQWLESAS